VPEGLARIFQLLAPVIAVSGTRALSRGAGAGIIVLLIIIPDDLVIRMRLIGRNPAWLVAKFSTVYRANKFCSSQTDNDQVIDVIR
jgi:hypothetical protein